MIWPHPGPVRQLDPYGSGFFCAPRNGRHHPGLDIITVPGDEIRAPFSGVVSKIGYPYHDDLSYQYVDVASHDFVARVMYVEPEVFAGEEVTEGQLIGTAQDLMSRYSADSNHAQAITNHIHFGLRLRWGKSIVGGRSGQYIRSDATENWIWINPTVVLSN